MLDILLSATKCNVCNSFLEIDQKNTLDDYSATLNIDLNNVSNDIDKIIGKYLIYKCSNCGELYKYTYKDLEYNFRRVLTEKFVFMLAKGDIVKAPLLNKFYIYCGKCTGYDSLGGCPKIIFDECKIKRFPINEL